MGFESVYRLSVVMQMIDNLSQPMKSISGKAVSYTHLTLPTNSLV